MLVSFKFFVVLSSHSLPRDAAYRPAELKQSFVHADVLTRGRYRLMDLDVCVDIVLVLAFRKVEKCRSGLGLCIVDRVLARTHLLPLGLPALRLK